MKGLKNVLIQFAISFTVLSSVFVWYAAWNDVVSDGSSLTHTMWNDLVTQVGTVTWDIPPVLQWYIRWLTISNDSWDTNNDIQIDVWTATSSDGLQYINLAATMTKRLDAGWTAWDNGWWLATGSKASNTWYYVFLIWKTDGSVDAWFDTSTTASNLLSTSGYNKYKRVWAILTDGSSNIRGFKQYGDNFFFDNEILDANPSPTNNVFATYTLNVPRLGNIVALIRTGQQYTGVWVTSSWIYARRTGTAGTWFFLHGIATSGYDAIGEAREVPTNSSAQIDIKFVFSAGTNNWNIYTQGWIDDRSL
jgi:hypothetical protein